jgi:hypothetical protein
MKRKFVVTVEMPPWATVRDMTNYIRDAVQTCRGGLDPEDPVFDLDPEKVKVKSIPEVKGR